MIFYCTGDTHGNFTRFLNMKEHDDTTEKVGVIVLGDCAVNWTLDPEQDKGLKKQLKKRFPNFEWFLLRGNHDARPTDVSTMGIAYNEDIQGYVYEEPMYPTIHYLMDGGIYTIEGHSVLAIGGAYSVDKDWRLFRHAIWHANEQLTHQERNEIFDKVNGNYFDIVLTHTCPITWQPTDLFMSAVNQTNVDSSMELWLDKIRQSIHFKIWLFGHYHQDRLERPGVQLMYETIEPLNDIWERWNNADGPEYWLPKAPMYYA